MSDIIQDSIAYPTKNIQALVIYLILGFLVGVVAALTGLGSIATGTISFDAGILIGIIGIILIIALYLLMFGFSLDIIKFAILRRDDAPEIDFTNQVSSGLKYLIITIVYMIIPIIILIVAGVIFQHWIVILLGVVLSVIFSFALIMAICRLAETDDLSYALNVGGAIDDLRQIGVGNVILTVIAVAIVGLVIVFVISFIVGLILAIFNSPSLTSAVSLILSAIFDAWLLFYMNRAVGLIYSNK